MRGDGVVAVEHAHETVGGGEDQRLAHKRVRDRVVVAVEAQVRRLAGAQRLDGVARERMCGQRQKSGPLIGQGCGDGALVRIAGDETGMGDALDPLVELGVEVVDGAERAGGEEGVAQVADGALDASFLIASCPRARASGRSGSDRQTREGGG